MVHIYSRSEEWRGVIIGGLCVAVRGSVNKSPPSWMHIHRHTAITACEREITEMYCHLCNTIQLLFHIDMMWVTFDLFSNTSKRGFMHARTGGGPVCVCVCD